MRSRPAPLGAWVYKNFNCCGPPAAPEFLKPAHPIQFPPQGQPVSGPYASSESFLSFAGGCPHPPAVGSYPPVEAAFGRPQVCTTGPLLFPETVYFRRRGGTLGRPKTVPSTVPCSPQTKRGLTRLSTEVSPHIRPVYIR